MTKARKRRKAAASPPKPRDPFAQHLQRRGQAVEPPGKLYKRRPNHPKPPSKDGGFDFVLRLPAIAPGDCRQSVAFSAT